MTIYAVPIKDKIVHININIPDNAQNVGLMLSDGLDSTILLCALALQSKVQNFSIIAFTVNIKTAILTAKKIIRAVEARYNIRIEFRSNVDNPGATRDAITPALRLIAVSEYIDIILTGVHIVPSKSVVLFNADYPTCPASSEYNKNYPKLYLPFYHLNKREIVGLAKYLNIIDILEMTESCPRASPKKCNQCFACLERTWGFFENGIVERNSYINLL